MISFPRGRLADCETLVAETAHEELCQSYSFVFHVSKMLSFKSVVFAVAAAFVAVSHADYVIDPTTVALSKRRELPRPRPSQPEPA